MAKTKQEKIRFNEEKSNIFRDSKRRIVYPINYTNQAHVLNQDALKRVFLYDTLIIVAVVPLALVFGLTARFLFESVIASGAIYLGFMYYFHKVFLPKYRTITLKPEDFAYIIRPEILKAKRQEHIIRGLMMLIILILISNAVFFAYAETGDTFELIKSVISIFLVSTALAVELRKIFTETKLIRKSKRVS